MARRLGQEGGPEAGAFKRAPKAAENPRTSFRLPTSARQEMHHAIADAGYGLRGKSRWVMEAVEDFLDQSYWERRGLPDAWKRLIVDNECVRIRSAVTEAVTLSTDMRIRVWRASIDAALFGAELDDPVYLEISIASVLRAAVLWRLGLLES